MNAPTRPTTRALEALDADTCWAHLREATVARVAHVLDGVPHLSVVNITTRGDDLLVRSAPGGRLAATLARPGAPVAIEVDDLDVDAATGWTVIAQARMEAILDQVEVERLHREQQASWLLGDHRGTWLRLSVDGVTGRRIYERPS